MTFATTRAEAVEAYHSRSIRRRTNDSLRNTWVMVREFRDGLLLFIVILLVGAWTFKLLWDMTHPSIRFIESLFHMMAITFFQPTLDFPGEWYLDVYFFVMPLLGVIALAHGLADFAALLFNRRAHESQWEEAVASTFRDHIIIAGLGHLGIRVIRELVVLDEEVVVIEKNTESPRFDEARSYGVPIITGDARNPEVLKRAGLEHAISLIICTNDDLANLQIASRVREVNPSIRIVMRMFDDEFARSMADRFDVSAVMSASMMAAPAFAGAAAGTEIVQTFRVADQTLTMGRIEVRPGTRLDGSSIQAVEEELDLSVVLLQSGEMVDVRPQMDAVLHSGDVVAVVATLPRIKELASRWNRPNLI